MEKHETLASEIIGEMHKQLEDNLIALDTLEAKVVEILRLIQDQRRAINDYIGVNEENQEI